MPPPRTRPRTHTKRTQNAHHTHHATPRHATPRHATPHHTTSHHITTSPHHHNSTTPQHHNTTTTQHNTTQHNTTQHNTAILAQDTWLKLVLIQDCCAHFVNFLTLPIWCFVRELLASCACAVDVMEQPRSVWERRWRVEDSGASAQREFWGLRPGPKLSQGIGAHQCGRRGEHGDGGGRLGQEPGRTSSYETNWMLCQEILYPR